MKGLSKWREWCFHFPDIFSRDKFQLLCFSIYRYTTDFVFLQQFLSNLCRHQFSNLHNTKSLISLEPEKISEKGKLHQNERKIVSLQSEEKVNNYMNSLYLACTHCNLRGTWCPGGVLRLVNDRDDRMEAKLITPKNPWTKCTLSKKTFFKLPLHFLEGQ